MDYLKLSTTDFDHKALLRHPSLNFSGWTDLETSEIHSNKYGNKKYVSYLKNLKIVVYENSCGKFTLCVLGSIHKFFNNGKHNFNDYFLKDIIITIDKLGKLLFFNAENCRIHNIEIGFNISPMVKTKTILKGLLSHKNVRFKSYSIPGAELFEVIHNNYIIKVYDKAKQYRSMGYDLPDDIIRIELKYKKMADLITLLNSKKIINRDFIVLSDLKNISVLVAFGELVIKIWNEILFYDFTINKKFLSESIQRKLDVWQNINQWESFNKQKRLKQKKILKEVIKKHSQQLQLQISNLINEKLDTLLQKELQINHIVDYKIDDQLTTDIDQIDYEEGLPINTIFRKEDGIQKEIGIPMKLNELNNNENKLKELPNSKIVKKTIPIKIGVLKAPLTECMNEESEFYSGPY